MRGSESTKRPLVVQGLALPGPTFEEAKPKRIDRTAMGTAMVNEKLGACISGAIGYKHQLSPRVRRVQSNRMIPYNILTTYYVIHNYIMRRKDAIYDPLAW